MSVVLKPEPLTRAAFAPFGDVIEMEGAHHYPINEDIAERYHDLAAVDVAAESGRPLINFFRGQPRPLPIAIRLMERHPLGSQTFYPLQDRDWLVVVADPREIADAGHVPRLSRHRPPGRELRPQCLAPSAAGARARQPISW